MKAHKKTKLFRHFMTILNMLALAVPLFVLGFHALNDSLPKYFASQSVQHHGGESDVFSDDLDYANEQLKTRSLDDNLMLTMDSLNYMNYGIAINYAQIDYTYETNDVIYINGVLDTSSIIDGNFYDIQIFLDDSFRTLNYEVFSNSYINALQFYSFYTSGGFIHQVGVLRGYPSLYNTRSIYLYPSSYYICQLNVGSDDTIRFSTTATYFTHSRGFLHFIVRINDIAHINLNSTYFKISRCPSQFLPFTIVSEESTSNITSLDDWKTYYNNKNYAQIINTGVNTHLPLNFDFVSLFTQSDIINHDGNIATLLFINFYCNWILNISLIIFFPQVIMCFINWAIDLIYKFTDVKGD